MSSSSAKISQVRASPDGQRLTFVIDEADVALVNALRRIILSEIPNVAFDANNGDITIHANSCSLHNEFIAHRLSMVPVCFEAEEIETFDSRKYKFTIDVKNTSGEMMAVTTEHIKVVEVESGSQRPDLARRLFPRNKITNDHILITKLKPNIVDKSNGDELRLEAYASVNVAKTHACFSPVSLCTYYNAVDEDAAREAFVAHAEAPSTPSLDEKTMLRRFNAMHRERYFKKNARGEPSSFVFSIESECRVSPTGIFLKAIDVLADNLRALSDRLEEVNEETHGGLSIFHVKGFEHTVGNVVQSMLYDMHVARGSGARGNGALTYIGYFVPHPLESSIVFKLKADRDAKQLFRDSLSDLADDLGRFRAIAESQLKQENSPENV